MDNTSLLILIAIICTVIGFTLGLVVNFFRRGEDKTADRVSARPTPKNSEEILNVWQHNRTGKVLATLDGTPISPSKVTEIQKKRLTQVLVGIYKLLGEPAPSRPEHTSAIQEKLSARESVQEPASTSPIEEAIKEPSPAKIPLDRPLPPIKAPETSFSDSLPEPPSFRDALRANPFKKPKLPTKEKDEETPKSIVEQIDEILQAKLENSPFSNLGIELKDVPGGMRIIVGPETYDSIDDVMESEIKALIKAAAREWNERNSLKRNR